MIPSFAIMGMSADYENMAKKVQEFAHNQLKTKEIHNLVNQLENACQQSCIELQEALHTIKNNSNG
jgi:hypothetical protein